MLNIYPPRLGDVGASLVADMEQKDATIALLAIGRRIQSARKKSRMSVAKLSAKTAISTRFIEYIEAGEFSKLPGRSHVLGFTRSICPNDGIRTNYCATDETSADSEDREYAKICSGQH
jgi:hypothetical protein